MPDVRGAPPLAARRRRTAPTGRPCKRGHPERSVGTGSPPTGDGDADAAAQEGGNLSRSATERAHPPSRAAISLRRKPSPLGRFLSRSPARRDDRNGVASRPPPLQSEGGLLGSGAGGEAGTQLAEPDRASPTTWDEAKPH